MKVLALTSSTQRASIAIRDEAQSFERTHHIPRGHTEFMNAALDELLAESGWSLRDIDLIAVDQGPGSFTGIRVTVSVARSLCYLLKKPCFLATSLSILSFERPRPLVAGLNAYKNLIFASLSLSGSRSTEARVLNAPELESWISSELGSEESLSFLGDAWTVYQKDWSPAFQSRVRRFSTDSDHPRASDLALMGLRSQPTNWIQDWKLIVPLYLRESSAEENLRKL